jgi:PKHD-type hydroxylase
MRVTNPYFYFKSAIPEKKCKEIIAYGLSKMTVDEQKGISSVASTFDGKEKGGVDMKGNKATGKATGGANKQTLKKKGIDDNTSYVRDSYISWLNDRWLYDLFHPYVHEANQKAGWGYEWDFSESFQFTVYKGHKTQGQFYGWHADGQSDWPGAYKPAINTGTQEKPIWHLVERNQDGSIKLDGQGKPVPHKDKAPLRRNGNLGPGFTDNQNMWDKVRKISMTVNLTNPKNYAGGNLKFDMGDHSNKKYKICEEIRPTGSIIIFPSYQYHCVTPVTRGIRYSLVLWSLGRPFR